jgi:hypothetical protein
LKKLVYSLIAWDFRSVMNGKNGLRSMVNQIRFLHIQTMFIKVKGGQAGGIG